jgi:hypothetical protein
MENWQMFVKCTSRGNATLKAGDDEKLVCQIDLHSVLLFVVLQGCVTPVRTCHLLLLIL